MAIQRRNHQTEGRRLMRIRRVAATDGGPIAVRSGIVHYLVSEALSTAAPRDTYARREELRGQKKAALAPQLAELAKEHAGDDIAYLRAAMKLQLKYRPSPFTPTALNAGVRVATHVACVLALPMRQSLPDLAAGIVTTLEP
jgi:hypothetical protein